MLVNSSIHGGECGGTVPHLIRRLRQVWQPVLRPGTLTIVVADGFQARCSICPRWESLEDFGSCHSNSYSPKWLVELLDLKSYEPLVTVVLT
jgi:hypothetical protein